MFSLIFLIAFAFSINVRDCSDGTGAMYVDQIDVVPDPPQVGVDVTATVQFRVTQYVDTLNCTMTVKKFNVPIYKIAIDFCEALTCPLNIGPYNTTATVPIPSYTPVGSYGLTITCLDASKQQNVCAETDVTIAK